MCDVTHLKSIKDCLVSQVQTQMTNLKEVDTNELGEAIDMIKDMAEAIYYCTITEAMEKSDQNSYSDTVTAYYRDMDRHGGRMYYSSGEDNIHQQHGAGMNYYGGHSGNFSSGTSGGQHSSTSYYSPNYHETRDIREGRSPMSRKNYMESKEMGIDKAMQVKELEKYISELTSDITEMIEGASQEEKQLLQRKISTLATKIV